MPTRPWRSIKKWLCAAPQQGHQGLENRRANLLVVTVFSLHADTAWRVNRDLQGASIVWNLVSGCNVSVCHSEAIYGNSGKFFSLCLGKQWLLSIYKTYIQKYAAIYRKICLIAKKKKRNLHWGLLNCLSKVLVCQPVVRIILVYSIIQ